MEDKLYLKRHCIDYHHIEDVNILKYLHRISVESRDMEMKRQLKEIMESKEFMEKNVYAEFAMEGERFRLETGYEMDEFASMRKVQRLMKTIGHSINPQCAVEMKSDRARETHLKSHAEKKALAVLMEHYGGKGNSEPIVVRVSMRMCVDCIEFFRKTSQCFLREIHCVDPKCTHVFTNGEHIKR